MIYTYTYIYIYVCYSIFKICSILVNHICPDDAQCHAFFLACVSKIDEDLWPLLKLEEQLEATLFLPLEDHCFFLDSFFFCWGGECWPSL